MDSNFESSQNSWMSAIFIILAILLVPIFQKIISIYKWFKHVMKCREAIKNMPGPEQHWFWGNVGQIPMPGEKMIAWGKQMTKDFPRYNKFAIGWWRPEVNIRHPEPIKEILKTAEPKAMSGGGGYSLLSPWLGDGLLLSSGQKWFRNRKLLTPGFHFDVLKPYMDVYNQAAETLIGKWSKESQTGASVEIYKAVSLCTLDVMLRCAFSFESDVQHTENKYVKTVNSMAGLLFHRAMRPWLYLDRLYYLTTEGKEFKQGCDYAHEIAYELIHNRMKLLKNKQEEPQKKYVDFLDILLLAKDEGGDGLSELEIREEVDTFLFEGHDTTASAISWILYALASHPEIQQKCRDEVQEILAERKMMEWDDLGHLPYTTQCIKEAIRMYSPVPFVMRELTKPFKLDDFTLLPKTQIIILIYNLHHNPDVWGEDHDEFKPERFTQENMQKMDSHAFIPFSAGPRNCIGQNFAMHEIKVIIAKLVNEFRFSVDPDHKVEICPLVTTRPKQGIKLFMERL